MPPPPASLNMRQRILRRLRTDYQLALVSSFGAFAALCIAPFAFYRYFIGDLWLAALDATLVLAAVILVGFAWRTGRTTIPGILLALSNTAGAAASALMLGTPGLFWMYAVQMTNFFLASRVVATGLNLLVLAVLVADGRAFESTPAMFSFIASSLLVSMLSFVLSSRTELQRKRLQELATRDVLTGVSNRRGMEDELQIAVAALARNGQRSGIVLFDIDSFKSVNDRFGHEAGDDVLLAVAEKARANTRSVDRVFRMGGDEFVLLLQAVSDSTPDVVADHLRRDIEASVRSPGGPVTVSVGTALLSPRESWQEWLARADQALYRAKRRGRNRSVSAEMASIG